uniref:Uncharacterized protein n=1 Tax=Candidatus Kentrum sp. DK TaxID=2126562 RepID=A0A450SGB6_9GAMM|nr:MAG: hypothetical protein BECKDK2373B_GA0170837_103527 [Candidatus Kentron sp. DK]
MNNRIAILMSLVSFSKPLNELDRDLSELDWDYDGEPLTIRSDYIVEVLQRCISGEINTDEIEGWANLIECREDLEFENEAGIFLENTIYRLANPVLEGEITPGVCEQLLIALLEKCSLAASRPDWGGPEATPTISSGATAEFRPAA